MKRFREGYKWNSFSIGIVGRYDIEEGMEFIPFDHQTGQLMFRWMVE
jgi:hypothetical protein